MCSKNNMIFGFNKCNEYYFLEMYCFFEGNNIFLKKCNMFGNKRILNEHILFS